ncbi:MAG TPA: BtuF-related (seleno)protein, partial [Ilumatobacteraceae bacterium]|nr:BtuF-related (seleno)protein [Ilumatobacteraceae bacterium]
MRILSLLPSATEMLFQLGLGDQVVGVTFECDFPPEARS